MRDKLTKKRIKVDYLLVIQVAGCIDKFCVWQKKRNSKVSFNRQAYAFCKQEHIDVDRIYSMCLANGLNSAEDYLAELIRIAKTPWLDLPGDED